MGFVTEELVCRGKPDWPQPTGQRITLAFHADSPEEVDATFKRMTSDGYIGLKEPWDAFWGQR